MTRTPEPPDDRAEPAETTSATNDLDARRTEDMSIAPAREALPVHPGETARGRTRAGAMVEDVVTAAYETHQRELYSFALTATRDPETSQEIVQEAYLRLVREAGNNRVPDNVRAWLYRVVANLVTTRWRRNSVADRFRSIFAPHGHAESPEADFLREEASTELHEALRSLAPDARVALLLSAHGFSGREIAHTIGRSEQATRTMMCRARIALRERLEREEPL